MPIAGRERVLFCNRVAQHPLFRLNRVTLRLSSDEQAWARFIQRKESTMDSGSPRFPIHPQPDLFIYPYNEQSILRKSKRYRSRSYSWSMYIYKILSRWVVDRENNVNFLWKFKFSQRLLFSSWDYYDLVQVISCIRYKIYKTCEFGKLLFLFQRNFDNEYNFLERPGPRIHCGPAVVPSVSNCLPSSQSK